MTGCSGFWGSSRQVIKPRGGGCQWGGVPCGLCLPSTQAHCRASSQWDGGPTTCRWDPFLEHTSSSTVNLLPHFFKSSAPWGATSVVLVLKDVRLRLTGQNNFILNHCTERLGQDFKPQRRNGPKCPSSGKACEERETPGQAPSLGTVAKRAATPGPGGGLSQAWSGHSCAPRNVPRPRAGPATPPATPTGPRLCTLGLPRPWRRGEGSRNPGVTWGAGAENVPTQEELGNKAVKAHKNNQP